MSDNAEQPKRGRTPGSGKKKGTPNKRTLARIAVLNGAATKIAAALGDKAFPGNAYELLVAVYKDTSLPFEIRMDAAKAAAPYEKPRLNAVDLNQRKGKRHEDWIKELTKEMISEKRDGSGGAN